MARVRSQSGRRGVTTVEAMIVFPVLLTLTFGACEYGWLMLKAQEVANAARHGARTAAVAEATNDDVLSAVDALMASAGLEGADYTVSVDPVDIMTIEPGQPLTIEVSVPTDTLKLTGLPLPIPAYLRSSVTMAKEGQ